MLEWIGLSILAMLSLIGVLLWFIFDQLYRIRVTVVSIQQAAWVEHAMNQSRSGKSDAQYPPSLGAKHD